MATGKPEQLALDRLTQERKNWRKDHPVGFYAKPKTNADGTLNLLIWECGVPGKAGTAWEKGVYKVILKFKNNYPFSAPECFFSPCIYHPNVWPDGRVCVSWISGWNPSFTLKQMMLGLQDLLDDPNPKSPANGDAADLFRLHRKSYDEKIRAQARKFMSAEDLAALKSTSSSSGLGAKRKASDDDIIVL